MEKSMSAAIQKLQKTAFGRRRFVPAGDDETRDDEGLMAGGSSFEEQL